MPDRPHSASRSIAASPQAIYDAFLTAKALAQWLPPADATAAFELFEPSIGGRFRMVLTFTAPNGGKSSANTDVVEGRFVDLAPARRIVWAVEFASEDPAFAGTMTMHWTLSPTPNGALVEVVATGVPRGIGQSDHETAIASTLEKLARFVE